MLPTGTQRARQQMEESGGDVDGYIRGRCVK